MDANWSDEDLESKALPLKLGVFVETGKDDSLRLGGNLSSRLNGADGLKLDDDAIARGGKALLGKALLGKAVVGDGVLGVGKPLGGVNKGAGCREVFEVIGNEFADTFDSRLFAFPNGEPFTPDELDENPFGGVLLNISKPVAAFPGLLDGIGPGPVTSGMV